MTADSPASEQTQRMIRVDHAGEYGATRIYAGQLAVLGRGAKGDVLRHMQAQEQHHLRTFNALIADRRVRPTLLLPLWHIAGFALGAVTAALGEKTAMACTVAVEDAIDAHYSAQIDSMDEQRIEAAPDRRDVPHRGARAPRHRAGKRRRTSDRLSAAVLRHQGRLPRRHRRLRACLKAHSSRSCHIFGCVWTRWRG